MAKIYRKELCRTIRDLLQMGQTEAAVKVSVALGKFEIEDHLWHLQNDEGCLLDDDELPRTFGDLHDTCDANEFGGLCTNEVFDQLELMSTEGDFLCDFGNAVQNELNSLIKRKALTPQQHEFEDREMVVCRRCFKTFPAGTKCECVA